jgi:hypothetical protein
MRYKFILTIIILAVFGGSWYLIKTKTPKPDVKSEQIKIELPKTLPSINGLEVEEKIAGRRPIAVIVENHPDARPQSGLSEADIVYETVAEGGITRLLAIFQTTDKIKIGPIRSVRPYFLDLAQSYKPLFVHVGGSDEALNKIKSGTLKGLDSINEFYQGPYFERIKSKPAPHNTYASIEDLRGYITDKNLEAVNTSEPVFKLIKEPETKPDDQPITTITTDFSLPEYKVTYKYDPTFKNYIRYIGQNKQIDNETKRPVEIKNLLIQTASINPIPKDPKLRVTINLEGKGELFYFSEGKLTKGYWQKNTLSQTKFFDQSNTELKINPGKTWISIISNDNPNRVNWTNN